MEKNLGNLLLKNVPDLMLVAGAIVFKRSKNGQVRWFLVKGGGEDKKGWEIPKALVRKGESSARTVLRIMGEQGGMNCRILEEAGRIEDYLAVNGKKTPRRIIYYLVLERSGGEVLGFDEFGWFDYSSALRKISWEKEKVVFRAAKKEFDIWLSRQRR